MISEPFGRQFDVDAPERAPSAARLAAEAFFAPRSEPAPGEPTPEVVVRRSKLQDCGPLTPVGVNATREPRVFRLPAPHSVADVTGGSSQEAAVGVEAHSNLQVSQLQADPVPVQGRVVRRKKRRHLHGEVTITRPASPVAQSIGTTVSDTTLSLVAPLAEETATTSQASGAELRSRGWPRYLALRRQLLALQIQAHEAKMHEARAALTWIHQAIADYNLTLEDHGFPG